MKRFWKILLRTVLVLLLLLITSWLLIQTAPVQNWLVHKATARLSNELGTKVEVKHVDFSIFNKILLEGTLVQDKKNDTLLYAGALKVRITDWFFLKDKAVLKYVGLDNTQINLKRTDSVWNYQFLVDYFSSGSSSKTKKKGIEWDIKEVDFKNVTIRKWDSWRGEDLTASLKSLQLNAEAIDFEKHKIAVSKIDLIEPVFSIYNYDGNRPPLSQKLTSEEEIINPATDSVLKWNAAGWNIHVDNVSISNGTFKNDRKTDRLPLDYFDGKHFAFEKINARFKNFNWQKDTISTNAIISTRERTGLDVKKLSAAIKFYPEAMEFDSLDIKTKNSHLKNFFAMRYKNFNDDMADFIHAITLDGKFKESTISSDDIAFFAPALKTWDKEISLTGNIKGTIDNLGGKNVIAQAGKNTLLNGDFKLTGLPNFDETFIDFKANDFRTTYGDAITFVPGLRKITQPAINKLQALRFTGSFTGFIHDFVTFGTIQTNLGTVVSDLNMKLPADGIPAYSGNIKTDNFKLGDFLSVNNIGRVSGDLNVKGSGFNIKNLYTEVNGHLKQIECGNYNYQDIKVTGTFDKKQFDGNLNVNDPNIQTTLNGTIQLNEKTPSFVFDAIVKKLNLKDLGFTRQDLKFAGNISTNFSGSNIDNFLGDAHIFNAEFFNGKERLPADSLTIYSSLANQKKLLTVKSNELSASLLGDFNIADLPTAFQVFLNKYYPSYINIPNHNPQNENFQFDVTTGNISPFLNLFDKNIKGLDNATVKGNLNLAQNQLNVNLNVPQFNYNNTLFTDIVLTGKGDLQKLNIKGSVGDVMINDSLHLPNSEIEIESANNLSKVNIRTSASKTINAAELSALVETRKDGFKINFNPSAVVIDDKRWTIENNSEFSLSKTSLDASEVKLNSGEEEISISTEPSSTGSSNDLVVNLKKVTVEDILPFFLKQPSIEGKMSGEIRVTDPFNNLTVEGNPVIEQGRFEDDSIGLMKTVIGYNNKDGKLTFKVVSDNEDHRFNVDGIYHLKDSLRNNMDIAIRLDNSEIHWLGKYLGTLFGNIKGRATGTVRLVGQSASPDLIGNTLIKDGSFKVLYTQCTYKFDEANINFVKGAIDFGTIILKDTLNKHHTAKFSGVMYHEFFKNMNFQMNFSSDGILLLNTTIKDNNQFYGTAIGKISRAYLRGPDYDMKMGFYAEPTDSSHIILPASVSRESGTADFIVWRQYGKEMKASALSRPGTSLTLDMNLQANPLAKIDVILDDITGDVVKAQGRGNLNIHVGTKDNLTINGSYEVERGEYRFNFQTYWQYGFELLDGGNISWNGDPYDAKINIKARYRAKDVNLSSLTTLSGTSIKEKGDVDIIATLTNTLKKPEIKFEFGLPEGSVYKNDVLVANTLSNYQQNPSEMNKQVASLLLFNTFAASEQSFVSGSNTSSFLAGTAGQVIFNFVANSLKSLLRKLLKDPNIDPYITLGNSTLNIQNNSLSDIQAAAKLGFNYYILNGKIVIKVGGNVDYNSNTAIFGNNRNFLFNQDISMEYLINKQGKLRLIVFNRGNFDLDRGRYARTGLGFSYTKEFDLLFNDEKKKKQTLVTLPASGAN
ncbi:MAG: hypothetical protein EKK37_01910 [Sphingobacteriales bacterium]|nr:MAG: hypothetical protein EKK37_01910 [Sphingobacteriales bacterium]